MSETRSPAVAGMFYPAQEATLRHDIDAYLQRATPPDLAPVRAVIVPHAGYIYSGPVAAYAYRLLANQSTRPRRALILGPSHRAWFPGVAVADVDGFHTPLGTHPVDREFAVQLSKRWSLFSAINTPHGPEHCLEVQVPFIQTVLPDVPIVPMLFGDVSAEEVGQALDDVLTPDDLIIVSSDLSHYHSNEAAHTKDRRFLDGVLNGDRQRVAAGEACGQAPILALMVIAEARRWRAHLLDYRTSGDITGERRQVVGYAAVAYVDPETGSSQSG
jgi:MEMO1 family protein